MQRFTIVFATIVAFVFGCILTVGGVTALFGGEESRVPAMILLVAFALPMLGISSFYLLSWLRAPEMERVLYARGRPIETDLQQISINDALSVNGRNPFRIFTQFHETPSQQVHVFVSANIWFDPTALVGDRKIRVYVDPDDFGQYVMDLRFLPAGPG